MSNMISFPSKPKWFFYPGWVLLNMLAVVIAAIITVQLISLVAKTLGDTIQVAGQTRITEDFLMVYVLLPLAGLASGLVQTALLRRYLAHPAWWLGATLLGWLLPLALSVLSSAFRFPGPSSGPAWVIPGLILIGACIGLPQWLVLRLRVPHAGWWILANGLGWGFIGLLNLWNTEPVAVTLSIAAFPALCTAYACWVLLDRMPGHELVT